MPDNAEQLFTLYNKAGDSMPVPRRLVKAAVDKGWTPQNRKPPQPFTKPGFTAGFGAGINPFHQTPTNMPVPGTMGGIERGAADMLNMREIFNRFYTGDIAGGAGQSLGTVGGLLGPSEIGKGLKASGEAVRGLEVAGKGEAVSRAAGLVKELPTGLKTFATEAEKFVQPLRESLNAKFSVIHKLLEKESVPITPKIEQFINRLQKAEVPKLRQLGMEIGSKSKGFLQHQGRTAMEYMEAEGLRRNLMSLREAVPQQWNKVLKDGAELVDAEIQKVADAKGVGKARTQLRSVYGEIENVAKSVASDLKDATSKPQARMRLGPFHAQTYVGFGGGKTGISASTRKGAIAIAKKLGVDSKQFVEKLAREKLGTAAKLVGRGEQVGAVARGGISGGIGQTKPPMGP